MPDYKILLGYLSILIAVVAYAPYFRGILANKIKPHAFSWLIWSLLVGITFAAQVVKQGGAGSWATGFTSFVCFVIFLLALTKGDRHFVRFDWVSLSAAFLALALWWLTSDPTLSVILITLTDAFGFFPTLRKGYYQPHEDSSTLWALSGLKFALAIIALESYSLVTLLYPGYLFLTNSSYALFLLWRRRCKP